MISLTKSSCSSSINWFILQTLCPSHSFTLSCDWFSWCACTAAPCKTSSGSYLKAPRAIELNALPPEDLSPVTCPFKCLALPIFHLSEVREAMLNFSCSENKTHTFNIFSSLFSFFIELLVPQTTLGHTLQEAYKQLPLHGPQVWESLRHLFLQQLYHKHLH